DNRRLRMAVQRMAVAGFKQRLGLPAAPDDGRQPLERVLAALDWATLRRQVFESDLYSMLAELGLPLYITTNADSFMELALRERAGAESVRSLAVDWRTPVQPGAARPHFDFDPPINAQQPAVLHLYGTGADPLSVVLTEDDHLDYLARIARDYEYLLPTSVQSALASTTLLFLGYQLEDLDLKVILRGLLTKLDLERWGMLHVAVQLEDTPDDPAKQKELVQYLQRYFSKSKIDVYWGSTQQFVADLYARWQEYRHD
ncbi:MAG: SIR2 family protein, partial [Caldilinea sp.]|nr:SIR2 family protein [Caldilinea sp.]